MDNIMVAADGRAVIADFGTAVKISAEGGTRKVHPGLSIGGNTSHLAPEVLNCGAELAQMADGHVTIPYSRQSVFAAGVLMHEVATGEHPIEGYPGMRSSHEHVHMCHVSCLTP